jgi:flavorubredoxin
MNLWLASAPNAQVVHGATACMVSLNDLADRPPRILAHGETLDLGGDLGGRRIRWLDTPHVPHGWEAGVVYEETTKTLFCGDLFTHLGNGPALTSDSILEPAIGAEEAFQASALTPNTAPTIRMLAALSPARLAVMHGSSFEGDCAGQLSRLADYYEKAHAATSVQT